MNFINKTEKTLSILFCLLPIFLITGSFLPDLIASLMAVFFLIYYFKYDNLYKKFFYVLFVLFYFFAVINSFFFDYYLVSLKSSLPYIRFLFFSIIIYIFLKKNSNLLKYFFYSVVFALALVLITSFFEFLKIKLEFYNLYNEITDKSIENPNIRNLINGTKRRITGIFGQEEIMGGYLLRILPFYFGLLIFFFKKKETNLKLIIFFSNIIFGVFILISGDRAPLILFIFHLMLQFLFIASLRKVLLFSFVIFILSSYLLIYNDPVLKSRIIESTLSNIKGHYSPDSKPKILSYEHQGHFIGAIEIAKKFPLLGSGFKGFRNQCPKIAHTNKNIVCTTHPHNTYLHVLAETGVLGVLCLLICFFYISYLLIRNLYFEIFYKKKKFTDETLMFLISTFIILWPLTTSGSFQSNYLSVFIYLNIGFLIYLLKKDA
jgi:O-antigen ligase